MVGAVGEPHFNNWDSYEVENERKESRCISINVGIKCVTRQYTRAKSLGGVGEYADKESKRGREEVNLEGRSK